MHTLHCTSVKCYLTLKNRVGRPLWAVMMDDNAATQERRSQVKVALSKNGSENKQGNTRRLMGMCSKF